VRGGSGAALTLALAGCMVLAACATVGVGSSALEMRLATQNALFEEQYQADLAAHPLRATQYGDYRYNAELGDYSMAGSLRQNAADKRYLARLQAISAEGFKEQDRLSHELLSRELQQRIANFRLSEHEMPVSQMDNPCVALADLPLAVPLESVQQYEDYIARLHQIARVFTQTEEVLRAGMKDGLMPVKFLLEKVPGQCEGVIAADPFLRATTKFPAAVPAAEQERLGAAINAVVSQEVLPAYHAFGTFIATEYAPHGRTALAVSSLPGGLERYQNDIRSRTTVSTLSAEQIHAIGLREIERIQADMLSIAQKEGFADLASFRESLKINAKYQAVSAEQILEDFRRYIAQMQLKMPELFGYLPGFPVTVEAIPDFQAAMATHYNPGTADGKRPGRVVVATANFAQRSLIDDEATAYHEGVPGHHMQLSVAQQMSGLPKFRQHAFNSGYGEGWALYSEQLGKEVGFYQDPVSDYGRLSSELFRAVRLVVDTGIHAQGWSRDQVVEFFRQSGAVDEPTLQAETDRYIAWPAQALSYKLGQLKFRELRERAQRELGAKFDIRSFHDELLNGGVLPLDLLDSRIDSWIEAQKTAAPSSR